MYNIIEHSSVNLRMIQIYPNTHVLQLRKYDYYKHVYYNDRKIMVGGGGKKTVFRIFYIIITAVC